MGESGTSEGCTRVCGVRSIMLGDVASRLVGVGSQSGSVDGAKWRLGVTISTNAGAGVGDDGGGDGVRKR